MNQRIHEHKMTFVKKVQELMTQGGPTVQTQMKRGATFADMCEGVVTQVLQKPLSELNGNERVSKFYDQLKVPQQDSVK